MGATPDAEDDDPGSGGESESETDHAAEVEAFLAEVAGAEEGVALEMLAAFEKEQAGAGTKRRTWKQNKDRKLAARKDRRVFDQYE